MNTQKKVLLDWVYVAFAVLRLSDAAERVGRGARERNDRMARLRARP